MPQGTEPNLPVADTQTFDVAEQKINELETDIQSIKKLTPKLVNVLHPKPSLFQRIANFVHKLPLWAKIGIGVLLVVPAFSIGLLINAPVVAVLAIIVGVYYVVANLIIGQHLKSDGDKKQELTDSMNEYVDELDKVVESMDQLGNVLSDVVLGLEEENERLSGSIKQLTENLTDLSTKIKANKKTAKGIKKSVTKLEETNGNLKATVQEEAALIEENVERLAEVKKDYAKVQAQLAEVINKLNDKKHSFETTIADLTQQTGNWKTMVDQSKASVIKDKEELRIFEESLEGCLTNMGPCMEAYQAKLAQTRALIVAQRTEISAMQEEMKALDARKDKALDVIEENQRLQEEEFDALEAQAAQSTDQPDPALMSKRPPVPDTPPPHGKNRHGTFQKGDMISEPSRAAPELAMH